MCKIAVIAQASFYVHSTRFDLASGHVSCADPEGVQEVRTPLKNYKAIGFYNDYGLDPLEIQRATKPAFNVGPSAARQRNAI